MQPAVISVTFQKCSSLKHKKLPNVNSILIKLPTKSQRMEEYLIESLQKLNSNNYAELTLVIGNESCDLDSAVSGIVYAAYLNWQYNRIKCKVCTKPHRDETLFKDDIFIPILNVDRSDYELKTEVAYCLRGHGLSESNLVFRDDHDLQELVGKSKTNVVLVDHHVLSGKDQFLRPYVTEVIDHRPMQEWSYQDTRCTIETVGSCSTLVCQRIKDQASLINNGLDFFEVYKVCTELLHCAIILDTVNFSKEVNKATPKDVETVLFLENILKPADVEVERKKELDTLVKARSDVQSLTAAQLIKKDVKVVENVLIPSFPVLVKEFLQRPGALRAVTEALSQRGCSIALLLGMDLNGGLRRDMAIYSVDAERASQLDKFLQAWSSPSLQLVPDTSADGYLYRRQENLSASRKQYMQPLNQFLSLK